MLEDKVIALVRETIERPELEVTLDSSLEGDLGVDSFTAVMILRAIEDEFGIELRDDFIPKVRVVRDIVEELRRLEVDPGATS